MSRNSSVYQKGIREGPLRIPATAISLTTHKEEESYNTINNSKGFLFI